MMLLTYHAVSAGNDSRAGDFYTVTSAQLERHFGALAASGRMCQPLSALAAENGDWSQSFFLTFDDATADHAEVVAPLLAKRGWSATFFIPTAKLNRPHHLTSAQVIALARAGHVIGMHSHEHRRLDVLSDDDLRAQMRQSREILGELIGASPQTFAPPGGFINEHVREVALGFGAEVVRTMRWGYNRTVDRTHLETIPLNRHTDDAKFARILSGRQTRYLYFGKEALKACVPARAYERARASLFKLAGRN